MDSSGNFIVTWSNGDSGSPAPGQDVYFRRYNSSGTALTGETRVNTTTSGDQNYSSVAMNASGAFIVTWTSQNGQDGSGEGIYAQRYNAAGVAQGSEFKVNTTTSGNQFLSSAGIDSFGNFVITWEGYNQDAANTWAVYKQDYNADGTTFGNETLVNTTTSGDQHYPSVAMSAYGLYVVAWSGNGSDTVTGTTSGSSNVSDGTQSTGGGVYFQRYASELVVDTTSDVSDGTTTSIANLLASKGADGKISLREAITAANNSANVGGPDRIYFNIATSGVQTINLTSTLPSISGAVIIDGTTEPGFSTTPLIELNGTSAGSGWVSGLTLASGSSGSTIKGLAINRFSGDGILVQTSNNVIAGNFLGTDASGTIARGNSMGVVLDTGSTNNRIGGTTSTDRNIDLRQHHRRHRDLRCDHRQ